jgi:hypothetical protein
MGTVGVGDELDAGDLGSWSPHHLGMAILVGERCASTNRLLDRLIYLGERISFVIMVQKWFVCNKLFCSM